MKDIWLFDSVERLKKHSTLFLYFPKHHIIKKNFVLYLNRFEIPLHINDLCQLSRVGRRTS